MITPPDLRLRFFSGLEWYEALKEPTAAGQLSAWFLAKDPEPEWYVQTLNVALQFAIDNQLEATYRQHFAAIAPQDLSPERAQAEARSVTAPIWNYANELLVAQILCRVVGWTALQHEPLGRGLRHGDWEFRAPSGRRVFVEVKSFAEVEHATSGRHIRPDYRPRVRAEVRRAYSQLPSDGRATLIVLVGREITKNSFGLMHGAVFEAMFGQYQVRFNVATPEPTLTYAGPSFYDTLVHRSKHRRLGYLVGLNQGGWDAPRLDLYAIQNPYADASVALPHSDWGDVHQFAVDENGAGTDYDGLSAVSIWERLQSR